MKGEIVCQGRDISRANERKRQKGLLRKTAGRIVTFAGVGIILLLAVPIAVCGVLIAAVWWTTDKAVSLINMGKDI